MFGSILVHVGDCSQMEEYVTPHKKKNKTWSNDQPPILDLCTLFQPEIEHKLNRWLSNEQRAPQFRVQNMAQQWVSGTLDFSSS